MKLLTRFLVVAAAAVVAIACEKSTIEESIPETTGSVLYVADLSATRVSFDDQGSDGVKLAWETGDKFTLFDFGTDTKERLGDFTRQADGTFTSSDVTLIESKIYAAIYPATTAATLAGVEDELATNIETQDDTTEGLNHLDDVCFMSKKFEYNGSSDPIEFEYNCVIMTIKYDYLESEDARADKIVYQSDQNDDKTYTLTIDDSAVETGDVATHSIMILPYTEKSSQIITFTLMDGDNVLHKYTITYTPTKHEAGKRYTADLTTFNYSGGTGTEADPYQINTAADLSNFATNVSHYANYEDEYLKLTNDITADANFKPIGTSSQSSFLGNFDGDGHSVKLNLNNNTQSFYQALFGYMEGNNEIKNLTVTGSVEGSKYVGGILAYGAGGTSIINCHSDVDVTGNSHVGGIAGSTSGLIYNSYSSGGIIGKGDSQQRIGGLVGCIDGSTSKIEYCYSSGKVTVTSDLNIGALVGYEETEPTIPMSSSYFDNVVCNGLLGVGNNSSKSGVTGYTTTQMQDGTLKTALNAASDESYLEWSGNDSNEYPYLIFN